jgi:hypothetical protein
LQAKKPINMVIKPLMDPVVLVVVMVVWTWTISLANLWYFR